MGEAWKGGGAHRNSCARGPLAADLLRRGVPPPAPPSTTPQLFQFTSCKPYPHYLRAQSYCNTLKITQAHAECTLLLHAQGDT